VRRLVDEVMNAGRLDVIDELYTAEMAPGARRWITPFRNSFPDVPARTAGVRPVPTTSGRCRARRWPRQRACAVRVAGARSPMTERGGGEARHPHLTSGADALSAVANDS
jgi:hypothetical protein